MERVPGLRLDGQQVLARGQIAELICAGVVGEGGGDLDDPFPRIVATRLEEEHHVSVGYRIAAVGGDHAVQNGIGDEMEDESRGLLARAGDDGGRELVVFVVKGGAKAAPGCGQLVLGRRKPF